jgi:signal transduction histidine kinase
VSVRSESGDTIEVTVSDRGAGIAEEDLPHVFEPYVTGKRTGTGLGLAIARNVVEALGGGISAASTPGAGTTVRIRMPREARGAGGPSLGGAAAGTGEA